MPIVCDIASAYFSSHVPLSLRRHSGYLFSGLRGGLRFTCVKSGFCHVVMELLWDCPSCWVNTCLSLTVLEERERQKYIYLCLCHTDETVPIWKKKVFKKNITYTYTQSIWEYLWLVNLRPELEVHSIHSLIVILKNAIFWYWSFLTHIFFTIQMTPIFYRKQKQIF